MTTKEMSFTHQHRVWFTPNSKVHGANMGPTWGRQDPGGPQVGHVDPAVWDSVKCSNDDATKDRLCT